MVTVVLPGQLRELNGGESRVRLEAPPTVGAALGELRQRAPALYERICSEDRRVRPHVNVFVGRNDIRWSGGLETPLTDGCEVVVLPSVSGG